MNWKRLSPFAVPATIRLGIVLGVGFVLTYVLLVSDPTRIFRWVPLRTGKEIVTKAPDWAQHFVAYLAFSFLLMWYGAAKARWVVPCLIGLAGLHAVATEYLQRFVPHRTSDVKDLVVNFVGIAMGTLLGRIAMWFFDTASADVAQVRVARPLRVLAATPSGAPPVCGLSRDAIFVAPGELKPSRVLNYGFLGGLCVVTVTLLGTIHVVHGWQVQRHAGALMELGRKAQATGDLKAAKDYIGRYVGLVPSDVHARADYGLLLDQVGAKKRQVFMVFEDVLRADPTREDIRRRQIEVAMETGRHLDALAHVRFLRQSYPTDGKLDDQAGQCFEELAEFNDALKAYESALAHQPDLLDTYRRTAWLCQTRLDRTERARSLLDSMVERFPKSPTAWLTRGRFRKEFGSLEEAQGDIDRALLLDPLGAEPQLAAAQLADDRALAARASGRNAQARQIAADSRQRLQRAVEQHPDHIDLRLQLVQLETHFGSPADAQKQFDQLLKLSPRDTRGYLLLAEMNLEQGRFDGARKGIDKLPRTPALDAWRLFLSGRELMSQNEWAEAIVTFEEARRISTQTAGLSERIDLAVAKCHAAVENFEAETAAYRRALKSNSVSIPARLGLAACLLRQQKVAEAIAEFRPLGHLSQVRLQLVRLLIERNTQLPELAREWSEVDRLLDQSKQEQDDPVTETLLRAESLEARNQRESARQLLEEALAMNRDCIEFALALSRLAERSGDTQQGNRWKGHTLSLRGDPVQAETLLRQTCEQHPGDVQAAIALLQHLVRHDQRDAANALFSSMMQRLKLRERPSELAQCHVVLGQEDAAVAIYRQVLVTLPNDSVALRALAELHLHQNQRSAATPLLSKLLEAEATLPPSEVHWARRQLAIALAGQGDSGQRQKGLTLLDRNEQEGAKNPEDRRARAIILGASPRRADQQAAVKLLGELADRKQLLVNDRWLMARLFERLGQVEEADAQSRQVLAESTITTEPLAEFISSLIRRGQLTEAGERLDELRRRDPNSFATLALDLQWQVARGESVAARKRLEVVATSAKEVDRIGQLAGLAESLGRQSSSSASEFTTLAERLYRQSAAGEPRFVVELVRCLSAQGKSNEAFAVCLGEWSRLPAESAAPLAISLLAFPEERVERMQQLEARLLKAVEQQPRSLVLLTSLAELRGWQERYADSEELYRRVLGLDRENAVAANRLAWLLAMRQHDLDDAQAIIEKLIERFGPTPSLLDTRGCVFLTLRRTSAAQQAFAQAHEEGSKRSSLA
ncbi:MAG: hypothetical protein FD138_1346 [Planctomycetota bacterium]|nr:MAG: hypothetical protein FD138_1346 [Planctomycetota bacterium]